MYFQFLNILKLTNFSIKNKILYFLIHKRINKINNYIQNPLKTQQHVFKSLIKEGIKTRFGEEHDFNQITNFQLFKENIPVRTYEELMPYIQRIRNGEENILWPGKINWFAKSSGTTNAISKYIPITKESLYDCHLRGGKDMLSLYQNNFPKTNIYTGKGIMLGGTISLSKHGDYKEGDLSAILLDQFPFWVNYHRVPDIETALMMEWEEKLDKIAKQAINENITNLTGVPSWMLILLQHILKKTRKKNILEVWPNIELYMHGGVNFEPYRRAFEELIPSKQMNYLEGYNASEGFFAVQDTKESNGLLLMLTYGVFYEFIPLDKFKNGNRETINLKDVKLYTDYALVISTNSGLWRYLIGDVIQFVSNSPYRIKITGRTKSYINAFGEELVINNTDTALLKTCKELSIQIKDYTVAPIYINKKSGCHQWLIEFKTNPHNIELFGNILDKNLQDTNSDYTAKRYKNLIINKPEIVCLKKNTFYNWLKKHSRLGGQFKVPRLCNDRIIADEILSL